MILPLKENRNSTEKRLVTVGGLRIRKATGQQRPGTSQKGDGNGLSLQIANRPYPIPVGISTQTLPDGNLVAKLREMSNARYLRKTKDWPAGAVPRAPGSYRSGGLAAKCLLAGPASQALSESCPRNRIRRISVIGVPASKWDRSPDHLGHHAYVDLS